MTQTRTAIVPEAWSVSNRVSLPREPWVTDDALPIAPRDETAPRGLPVRDERVTSTRQDKILHDTVRKFG